MPRGLTADQIANVGARVKRVATFVFVDLPEPVRAWDGSAPTTVFGQRFIGLGQFGLVEGIESERNVVAAQIKMSLVGIPGNLVPGNFVTDTYQQRYQDAPVTIWFGQTHPETDVPVCDPFVAWSGFGDVLSFQLGSQFGASLTAENYSSHLRRSNGLRCTSANFNQSIGYPAVRDGFFDFNQRLAARRSNVL